MWFAFTFVNKYWLFSTWHTVFIVTIYYWCRHSFRQRWMKCCWSAQIRTLCRPHIYHEINTYTPISAFTPAEAGTRLSDPRGIQGWASLACYIPRWYSRPKTVTHPSTNRARRVLTSFMRRTPLTTTPRRQLQLGVDWALIVSRKPSESKRNVQQSETGGHNWDVACDAAFQLATARKVSWEDVRLYVEASEAAKEFVGRYFDRQLYFDYTHLVCRTALDPGTHTHTHTHTHTTV